ncbi:hypothetical protein Tco_1455009 [Tanacetum coccineum]
MARLRITVYLNGYDPLTEDNVFGFFRWMITSTRHVDRRFRFEVVIVWGGVVRWWCGDDGDDDGDKGGVEMVVMGCGLWAVVVVRGGDDYIDGEVIVVVMMEIGWWWRWCGRCERGHDGDMVVVMAMDLVNWWWGKCRSQRWGGNREGVAAMMVVSGGGRKPVGDDAVNC